MWLAKEMRHPVVDCALPRMLLDLCQSFIPPTTDSSKMSVDHEVESIAMVNRPARHGAGWHRTRLYDFFGNMCKAVVLPPDRIPYPLRYSGVYNSMPSAANPCSFKCFHTLPCLASTLFPLLNLFSPMCAFQISVANLYTIPLFKYHAMDEYAFLQFGVAATYQSMPVA